MAWGDGKLQGPEEQGLEVSHPSKPFTLIAQSHGAGGRVSNGDHRSGGLITYTELRGRKPSFAARGRLIGCRADIGAELFIATLICITACSQSPKLRVFNNTGGAIALHVTVLSGIATRWKAIEVGSGGLSAQFDYYHHNRRPFRISAAGCEITYSFPLNLTGFPLGSYTYGVPVQAQLEPDLTIFLVPFDAKTVSDVRLSGSLQVEGFPLRPTSRTCSDGPKT